MNKSNLENMKNGIPVMTNLIPGLNSGLTMNPKYSKGKLPPFFGQAMQNTVLNAINKKVSLDQSRPNMQKKTYNKRGKFNYRMYTNPL